MKYRNFVCSSSFNLLGVLLAAANATAQTIGYRP